MLTRPIPAHLRNRADRLIKRTQAKLRNLGASDAQLIDASLRMVEITLRQWRRASRLRSGR